MKKVILSVAVFLAANLVFAGGRQVGIVTSVDKEKFTIQPEIGEKLILKFAPDMGKKLPKGWLPQMDLGVRPDQIKRGLIVEAEHNGKEANGFVCIRASIIVEELGVREIDFAPLQEKEKKTLAPFTLEIRLQSRAGLGRFRPYRRRVGFKAGSTVKSVRDDIKSMLSRDDWKVKEVGDGKLLIEAYKDEEVHSVAIEAHGLPKAQQPNVRRLDKRDPSKDKESGDSRKSK
jgi:hypothetical protein